MDNVLNVCLKLLLSSNYSIAERFEINSEYITDILKSEKYTKNELVVTFQRKFDLVKVLSSLMISDKDTFDIMVDQVIITDKFKDFKPSCDKYKTTKYNDVELKALIHILSVQHQYVNMDNTMKDLRKFMDQVDLRKFESVSDMVNKYNDIITGCYTNVISHADLENQTMLNKLVLGNHIKDDKVLSNNIINQIRTTYDPKNKIKTGLNPLDQLTRGGFEKTRLYMFCGGSGGGKSTLLLNIYRNWCRDLKDDEFVVYFSMENLVLETVMRLLCMTYDSTEDNMASILQHNSQLSPEENAKNEQKMVEMISNITKDDSHIVYYPSNKVSVNTLITYIEREIARSGKKLRGVVVDYIDLLLDDSIQKTDMYRLMLGNITMALKTLAVKYMCPVATVTQPNKGVYNRRSQQESEGFHMDMSHIGESSMKINNADFIALLNVPDNSHMHLYVTKNRNGAKTPIDSPLVLGYIQEYYKLYNLSYNNNRNENINQSQLLQCQQSPGALNTHASQQPQPIVNNGFTGIGVGWNGGV